MWVCCTFCTIISMIDIEVQFDERHGTADTSDMLHMKGVKMGESRK